MSVSVPPPGAKGASRLPSAPPAPQSAPQNMAVSNNSEEMVSLNFRVRPELRNRVKLEAVGRNMSMVDMVEAAFKLYFETYPVKIEQKELF